MLFAAPFAAHCPDRARMRAQHARTQLHRAILRAELDAAMFITTLPLWSGE
jgi:hypothetical protein